MASQEEHESKPAGVAAAASVVGDRTVAEVLQAMETLTSVFGFEPAIALEAIDRVGTDVTTAYNYILDTGLGKDQGGPVVPIDNCPHVQHHVLLSPEELPPIGSRCSFVPTTSSGKGQLKQDDSTEPCPSDKENWICLQCGVVRCSRYVSGHGVVHYEETLESDKGPDKAGHCVAVSLADLSVWCHACRAYLKDKRLDSLVKKLEHMKFGPSEKEESKAEQKDEKEQDSDGDGGLSSDEDAEEEEDEESSEEGVRLPARGVPLLFNDEPEEEEIDYPFGSCPDNLKDVAEFIKSDRCKSILILAGAGMSVASGIPDFRSSGGLYDTLRPEVLTATPVEREAMRCDPTVALEMGMFLQNPLPCLELNRPFILGIRDQKWKATLAHRFVELLHAKTGKLTRLYQQNIDGLEGQCEKLPREKVVMVHGSMDRAECALCKSTSDFNVFCDRLQRSIKDISGQDPLAPTESTGIACDVCGYETLKPSIVLFRSPLPGEFFEKAPIDIASADLLIVIGTSLAVAPANTLVFRVPPTALRMVVNREPVGFRLGLDYTDIPKRDYFAKGDCDAILLDLMVELGWVDDLKPLVDQLPETSAQLLRDLLAAQETVDDDGKDS